MKIEVGDVVKFTKMPNPIDGDHELNVFGILKSNWDKIIGIELEVTNLTNYNGLPAFNSKTEMSCVYPFLKAYAYPIDPTSLVKVTRTTGSESVSQAKPATVSRKDSSMKFIPRTNPFVSNRVLAVAKDGPASKGGIKEGDVILRVGKYNVGVHTKISDIVRKLGPNRKITVKVLRNGKSKFCHVTLGRNANGKATLGISNNPKNTITPVAKKPVITPATTWADHARRIAESKREQALQAEAAAAKKALNETLERTKAEANTLKAKHEAAVSELEVAKAAAKEDNHFLKQAREELEGVQALLADMKGADALLQARALRAKLRAKNLNSMEEATANVNAYLNKVSNERAKEVELAPISTRRFSWKRAIAAASIAGAVAVSGAYAYINFFMA